MNESSLSIRLTILLIKHAINLHPDSEYYTYKRGFEMETNFVILFCVCFAEKNVSHKIFRCIKRSIDILLRKK